VRTQLEFTVFGLRTTRTARACLMASLTSASSSSPPVCSRESTQTGRFARSRASRSRFTNPSSAVAWEMKILPDMAPPRLRTPAGPSPPSRSSSHSVQQLTRRDSSKKVFMQDRSVRMGLWRGLGRSPAATRRGGAIQNAYLTSTSRGTRGGIGKGSTGLAPRTTEVSQRGMVPVR
jgi:hypothetical protein